ncbi:MAG: hypothetical protein ACTSU8_00285 [Alphaproteobacteria bacterium]
MKLFSFLLVFLFGSFPAFSQTLEEVQEYYDSGEFDEAIEAGRALGTLESLTIAIRAQLILVQYIYQPEDRLGALNRAIEDSELTKQIDPDHIEVLISTGILIGLRGRYERNIADGKEAERLFLKAIELDPNQSWALGAMGSWHAETLAEAGSIAGRLVFGAKRKLAWYYFNRAIEAKPDNLAIRAAYIRALLKIKPKKNEVMIRENFEYVLKTPAKNALERLMKEQVRQIKAAFYGGDREKLQLLLDEAVPLEIVPQE